MHNLTQEQKTVLTWLTEGNWFDVCSDYSGARDNVLTSTPLAVRIINRTIYRLYREGLIAYQVTWRFGIRWDRFEITPKGKGAVC